MTDAVARPDRPALLAPAAWAAVVVVASAVDPGAVAGVVGVSGAMAAGAGGLPADTVAHLLGYAVLAALVARALVPDRPGEWAAVLLVPIVLGALVELLQAGLPARTASFGDGLANAAGAVLGGLAWVGWRLAGPPGD